MAKGREEAEKIFQAMVAKEKAQAEELFNRVRAFFAPIFIINICFSRGGEYSMFAVWFSMISRKGANFSIIFDHFQTCFIYF